MGFVVRFAALGRDDLEVAGGKGANLGELVRGGLPVPPGFVVSTDAYREFVATHGLAGPIRELAGRVGSAGADAGADAAEDASVRIQALFTAAEIPDGTAKDIVEAYRTLADGRPVAVRSSATAEDLPGASFAGQQDTYLNVRGAEEVLDAVRRCWASLWTARAMGYRVRQGIAPDDVSLAVVVQTMVAAEAAGVMFTANPANGRRTEAVVAAAWGLGESVVGGSVNTDDLVLEKASGRVLSRRIADKTVWTVPEPDGGTTERPVPSDRRRTAVLDDAAAAELVGLGVRIEEHFGAPQDVEWVRADGRFQIVQARPITALPEPEADAPTTWPVPDPKSLYFRASIVEQLPDPLSPLFADLGEDSVGRSLRALMGEVFGRGSLGPDDISLIDVNGYAYYRYTRAAMWRVTWRSVLAIRMLRGGRFGIRGWRDHSHPAYRRVVDAWIGRDPAGLSAVALLDGVRELLDAGTTYYTAVQSIIPVAATSEIAFTRFYDRLVRRDGDPPAATFLLGADSLPILAEKSLYDLAGWTRSQPGLAAALAALPAAALAEALTGGSTPSGVDDEPWREWRDRFRAHLDRFGHTVYNLDFVNPVPADDPAPLLNTLLFYLRDGGDERDPHRRQAASMQRRERAEADVRARLGRPRRVLFDRLLRWAQGAAPIREDALGDIGLAWPPMRRLLLELGRRLAAVGAIGAADDVFWLREAELAELAAGSDAERPPRPLASAVADRRMLWRGRRRATPPQLLPERGAINLFKRWMPAAEQAADGDRLTGIGASAGQVTGTARVLAGPADFGRMQPGDVLVASITTPAWTTLFALASAVVTDIGGPLSHSSIVAREYGIPAVLGTSVATRRIRDGQQVRVDGDAGTVTLLPDPA
jgi:pyruvate,water dikinase